jgi:hypothetical protein
MKHRQSDLPHVLHRPVESATVFCQMSEEVIRLEEKACYPA